MKRESSVCPHRNELVLENEGKRKTEIEFALHEAKEKVRVQSRVYAAD